MDFEQDYIQYIIEFSLAFFAVSAAYFLDLSRPLSFLGLLLIPLLFGYTAYISREGFRKSSLLSLSALILAPLNLKMGLVGLVISAGNPLTSLFASGSSFKDYYGATMLPMLLTGVLAGAALFGLATHKPSFNQEILDQTSGFASSQTEEILNQTGLVRQQREATEQMIRQSAKSTIVLTQRHVMNETNRTLERDDKISLYSAFQSARSEVPAELLEKVNRKSRNAMDISKRVSDSVRNLLEGNLVLLVPVVAVTFYSLHPLVGILTALSAAFFARIDG